MNGRGAPRNETAWAIRHWSGGIYADTVRKTRSASISYFKETYAVADAKWAHDVRFGVHRCIRVFIVPIRALLPKLEGKSI